MGGAIATTLVHCCDNVLTGDIPSSKLACGNVANSRLVKISKYEGPPERVYIWEQPRTELLQTTRTKKSK